MLRFQKMYFIHDKEIYDPDQFEYFDQIEYLLGFGLIGLQTYMTETGSWAGLRKHETFLFGPKKPCGLSKLQILNAIANFWKHREEWAFEGGEIWIPLKRG